MSVPRNTRSRLEARRLRALERRERDIDLWEEGSHPTVTLGSQTPEQKIVKAEADCRNLRSKLRFANTVPMGQEGGEE